MLVSAVACSASSLLPILGADFLEHFGLQLNLRQRCLHDSTTKFSVAAVLAPSEVAMVTKYSPPANDSYGILTDFPSLTRPPDYHHPVKHSVVHRIETQGQPVFACPRRLAPDRLQAARNEFHHMLDLGIIRPSSGNWFTALHMVPKPNGDWRMATMWRLPPPQQRYQRGSLFHSSYS